MSADDKPSKGFTCTTPACGEYHAFSLYVFAHWDEQLHHKCSKCGALHHIQRGHVRISKRGRIRKTNPAALNGSAGNST